MRKLAEKGQSIITALWPRVQSESYQLIARDDGSVVSENGGYGSTDLCGNRVWSAANQTASQHPT